VTGDTPPLTILEGGFSPALFGSSTAERKQSKPESSTEVENETGLLMGDCNLTIKKKIQTDYQKK
jgi:hypothetical protein